MPFTLSHPAAALPLRRLLPWAPLTALAIGSMTPDFPYFVGWDELRFRTHSLPSVATFSIPVGLVTYFAYERWLRAAWCDLLPASVAARVPRSATHSRWLAVTGALALGALTHVLWDSFTHEHQPGVELVRALNVVIVELLGFPVRGYNLLQHGSTLVGLALLARWFHCWLRRTPRGELPASWERARRARRRAPLLACGALAPAAFAHALHLGPPGADLLSLRNFVGNAVVSGMSLTLGSLLAYAVWWWRVADGAWRAEELHAHDP